MLALTTPFTFDRLPLTRFLREALTPRMLILMSVFVTLLAGGFAAANMYAAVPSCSGGESLLLYPVYNRKGVVTDTLLRCGVRHRGCMPLSNNPDGAQFQCSPFMAPKTVR